MSDIFYNGIGKKDQYTEFILGRGENNETCVLAVQTLLGQAPLYFLSTSHAVICVINHKGYYH